MHSTFSIMMEDGGEVYQMELDLIKNQVEISMMASLKMVWNMARANNIFLMETPTRVNTSMDFLKASESIFGTMVANMKVISNKD